MRKYAKSLMSGPPAASILRLYANAHIGYSALIHVHLSTQPGAGCIPASVSMG